MASAIAFRAPPTTVLGAPPHELKVRIPVSLHLRLHAVKVLRRQSMSETVEAALAEYFEANPH